ncbi:hypothetical protein BZA77DRAFT_323306 [Pyronema omphalodes]|nr:hypothetical protein BZA77DRAFT_323306 [Pyronema omphalodes]
MVQRKKSSTPNNNERFVIGVDFGTTFTSVAFAHTASPEEVKLVQTWPNGGIGNASAEQVPTEVHYTNLTTRAKIWGYETATLNKGASNPEPLKWFKLLLQERSVGPISIVSSPLRSGDSGSQPQPGESTGGLESKFLNMLLGSNPSGTFTPPTITPAQNTAYQLRQSGISPVEVVTDFLSSVRQTTIAAIERTYDKQWVTESNKEFVLTVPAIWSDSARSLMVQAAQKAGFGVHRVDFNLISEPEAAAAHTLRAIQPNHLNCGDTFIICDAGGGTVDLISYKITNLDPLEINECVSGSGALAGSVYLDERFEQYIRTTLGDRVIDGMKPRSRKEMFRTWEEKVKFAFGNSKDTSYEITTAGVPDNAAKNVEDGFHTILATDVQKIFDPVIDCIVALVKQQVSEVKKNNDKVAAILLVGGFGSSEYLLKRLQKTDYGTLSPIQILQPTNARTAIARGALLRGLDGSIVKERRARKSYGCMSSSHYKPGTGTDAHRYWDSAEENFMVESHMNWYITRNQALEVTEQSSVSFCRYVPVNGNQPILKFTDELLACDLDNPPDYKWKNPGSVYRICTLTSNLHGISHKKFRKHVNSMGAEYYRIDFQLKMSLIDEVLKFELIFDGQSKGEVTAKFE